MNNSTNPQSTGGTGYLIVRVSTARGAIPLENARVTVRGADEGSGVVYSLRTDADGLTQKIALTAPPRILSEVPNNTVPYSLYNVDVFMEGFYDSFFTEVAIFDSVTSIQNAVLIPLADNEAPDGFVIGEDLNPFDRNEPLGEVER